jgi:hypothetical protein
MLVEAHTAVDRVCGVSARYVQCGSVDLLGEFIDVYDKSMEALSSVWWELAQLVTTKYKQSE